MFMNIMDWLINAVLAYDSAPVVVRIVFGSDPHRYWRDGKVRSLAPLLHPTLGESVHFLLAERFKLV